MKKLLCIVILVFSLVLSVGCTNSMEQSSTIGTQLEKIFLDAAKDGANLTQIATELSLCDALSYDLTLETLYPSKSNDLPGLSISIEKFTEGRLIQPTVDTIPFVMYVFETTKVNTLRELLTTYADANWNESAKANEILVASCDPYIFFVMCVNE